MREMVDKITGVKIKQGGLMRCCISSAKQWIMGDGEPEENATFQCLYCGERMRMKDGVVEWYPEKMGESCVGE